jgi:hypothetical protein
MGHELHRTVEAAGLRHLVDADPDGLLEPGAAVGLREVVENADQQGRGHAGAV